MTERSLERAPRVSVIMTIYNAAPYLREAIDSILAQTFADWELIAIENGSSDQSPVLLASYQDKRIRSFFLPSNIGRTPALRYAFERADGEHIAILDADDVSHPERLAQQVAYLNDHPEVGIVGSWAEYINEQGVIVAEFKPPLEHVELYDSLGWMNPFVHSSIMYRTRLGRESGGYPSEYTYAQDKALIISLSKISQLAMIASFLCKLRTTTSSMTASPQYRITVATERLKLLKEAKVHLALSEQALKLNKIRQAESKINLGAALLSKGSISDGLKHLISGVAISPLGLWNSRIAKKALPFLSVP